MQKQVGQRSQRNSQVERPPVSEVVGCERVYQVADPEHGVELDPSHAPHRPGYLHYCSFCLFRSKNIDP